MSPLRAALDGLLFGAGLIIAIGAQNSYILRQGIRGRFLFLTALTSSLADAALIVLGVAGLGTLIANSAWLSRLAAWGGILFLGYLGLRSLLSALRPSSDGLADDEQGKPQSQRAAVWTALGFSLLNPHVYLDTVVLIGTLGATYPLAARPWFAGGAICASFLWFFGLVYGAAQLAPFFERPTTRRVLDGLIAGIMWWIAGGLLLGQVL